MIGRNCLIGMNSVIMDNVELGDECVVGALSFIKANEKIPTRSLLIGNPAKVVKQVTEEMVEWKTAGTRLYQALPGEMHEHWQPCEPLREVPADRPTQETLYQTWNNIKDEAQ
jgi:phenylacetic acid degradation protein/carnitine operon protein CaiE